MAGMKLGDYGSFVGSDAGVNVRPWKHLVLTAGYRTFNLNARVAPDFAHIRLGGPSSARDCVSDLCYRAFMDAAPILSRIAELLNRHGLDAVLVGDAAAALQGSPVATQSMTFEYVRTLQARQRLARIASELGGTLQRQTLPPRWRMTLSTGLGIEFVPTARRRTSDTYFVHGVAVHVASPNPHLLHRPASVDLNMIRRWQALPPEKRTHFLRVRIGLVGSCL